jgi:formylmethanofuran dehydrogenase subunit C
LKQSELYNDILESETADKIVSEDTKPSISPDYTVRDAYNDWKSSLPDMPEDSEAFRQLSEIKDKKYEEALELASIAEYGQSDLFAFLKLDWRKAWEDDIENYENNPSSISDGIFASAFAEALDAQEVRVPDMSGVYEFGYRNSTDLIVEGDVGNSFGKMMENGKVRVKGDSDLNLAHTMKDGEIEVEGDVEGIWNPSGNVVVQGDVEHVHEVEGELIVKGDIDEIAGDDRFEREGRIQVEGEIGEIKDEEVQGLEVYKKQKGTWQKVFPR